VTTIHVPDSGINLTIEDLERLPKVEGYEYELDEGRLRIMAAAATRSWHGELALRVANSRWCRSSSSAPLATPSPAPCRCPSWNASTDRRTYPAWRRALDAGAICEMRWGDRLSMAPASRTV
jgi:hypothetical protein